MVKAMGRQRRGSKTGGVEPATISLAVLAAIAGIAGYGSTRGELSESDQLKIEAAVAKRLEAERRKNPRSGPCPDFKSERDRLLAKLAEYESSEIRFRLATPDQIVKVVETVKEKVMAKKGGAETASEPTSVATSETVPVAEPAPTVETPAAVEPVTETPDEKTDTEPAPTVETPDEKTDTEPASTTETPAAVEPVTETPAEKTDTEPKAPIEPVPNKPTADIPMTAELLPKPDLIKAGVILDSIPKAFSRPRLITVLIKLESATREPLDTLRKYFDEAFAKLEPGSKTPLKDALRKMRERGKKSVSEPVVPEPVVARVDAPVVAPVVEPTPEPVVAPVVAPVVTPPIEATLEPVVPPVVTPPIEATPEPVVPPAEPEGQKEFDDAFGQSGSPATETESTRRLSNLGQTLATTGDRLKTVGTVGPNIRDTIGKLNKSLESKGGGMRKKKLRTRRRDKQNVRRSSGRKNRSNRTDTYSSRRTEVDARGDELGL